MWSDPDNYCHTSADQCATCGMALYCGKPPPLISGNLVCSGPSRLATPCFDSYSTGMCAGRSLDSCQEDCRNELGCEMFVFYPTERKVPRRPGPLSRPNAAHACTFGLA